MSARQVRKEATRQRVLEAARDLFESVGYEGTTVRMIAKAAGVSVGSVFTTFQSKRDVLARILHERLDGLHAELDRLAPQLRGSTADRLRSIFAIHYNFVAHRPGLFLAYLASGFDRADRDARKQPDHSRFSKILHDCLLDGRARGDVCHKADLSLAVDLLMAAYVWTYRLIARDGAHSEAISDVMDRHIGLIAEGFAPRPEPVG